MNEFSFILKKDENWKLAPAYDVCYAYRPDSYLVSQHALSINGKRKHHKREDFVSIARSMNLQKANEIIDNVLDVVNDWQVYADKYAVDKTKALTIFKTLHLDI